MPQQISLTQNSLPTGLWAQDFFLSRPVKLESFWRSIQLAAQRPPSQGSLAPFPAVLAAAESTSSAEWPSGLARRSQPGQQHGAAGSPAAPTRPPPHPYTSRGTLHKPPPAAPTGGLDQWACRVSLSEVEVVPVRPSVTDVGALRVMVVGERNWVCILKSSSPRRLSTNHFTRSHSFPQTISRSTSRWLSRCSSGSASLCRNRR